MVFCDFWHLLEKYRKLLSDFHPTKNTNNQLFLSATIDEKSRSLDRLVIEAQGQTKNIHRHHEFDKVELEKLIESSPKVK
jgi:hypothetical protein